MINPFWSLKVLEEGVVLQVAGLAQGFMVVLLSD